MARNVCVGSQRSFRASLLISIAGALCFSAVVPVSAGDERSPPVGSGPRERRGQKPRIYFLIDRPGWVKGEALLRVQKAARPNSRVIDLAMRGGSGGAGAKGNDTEGAAGEAAPMVLRAYEEASQDQVDLIVVLPGEERAAGDRKPQAFIDSINGRSPIVARFEKALVLGVDSGTADPRELLGEIGPRVSLVIATGSEKGGSVDVLNAILEDPNVRTRKDYEELIGMKLKELLGGGVEVKELFLHSRGRPLGNMMLQFGDVRLSDRGVVVGFGQARHRPGPDGMESFERPGDPIPDISSATLVIGDENIEVRFSGSMDDLSPRSIAEGAGEAGTNLVRFVAGFCKILARMVSTPWTKEGAFSEHALKKYFRDYQDASGDKEDFHEVWFVNIETGIVQKLLWNPDGSWETVWTGTRLPAGRTQGGKPGDREAASRIVGCASGVSFRARDGWLEVDEGPKPDGEHWVWVRPVSGDEDPIPILLTREGENPDQVARWMDGMSERISPGKKAIMMLQGDPESAENRAKAAALERRGYDKKDIYVLDRDGTLYRRDGSAPERNFVEAAPGEGKVVFQLGHAARKVRSRTGDLVVVDPVEKGQASGDDRRRTPGEAQKKTSGVSMKIDVQEKSFKKDGSGNLEKMRGEALKNRPEKGSLSWPPEERGKTR